MVWAVPVSLAAIQGIARIFFLSVMAHVMCFHTTGCTRASAQKENSVYCFLFLEVLRCFTSLRMLPRTRVSAGSRGVSPFGHFRVTDCLASYRNLSQPYHVLHRSLEPRHPPYTLNIPARNAVHRCTILSVCRTN